MSAELHLHQTHHTIADFPAIFSTLKALENKEGLHIFPELFLAGYPLQDLVLQRSFIEAYREHQNSIHEWAKTLKGNWRALVGGLHYEMENESLPRKIENVIYEIAPGKGLTKLYTKRLLPSYDIFDEQKYFSAGNENAYYEFEENLFGLLICEDMWASSVHKIDPCQEMLEDVKKRNLKLKGIINLSASPFDINKNERRMKRANTISEIFGVAFIYINRVGGEDEVLFDGQSFIIQNESLLKKLPPFTEASASISIQDLTPFGTKEDHFKTENTWESLFNPRINLSTKPAVIKTWDEQNCLEALKALQFGLQEYAKKTGFKKFLVALSGGMDSALVLAIVKLALKPGQEVEAIYMPSIHSASLSTQLSEDMCKRLGIKLQYLPIKFLHSAVKNAFTQTFPDPFTGLTDENVQSRLRGMLLYTRSNQTNAMVINTSNKSELAVGYSTQYGDSVGAISLLGDLYKTEVYSLAKFINKHFDNIIPEGIIDRGPSAELRENQLDQDSLPPYLRLDTILEGILSYRLGRNELIELGLPEAEITKVLELYNKSEYKRAQFCPIIKVKAKSFGFGYRVPITKNFKFY